MDEGYQKSVRTNSAFNGSYIGYENKGDIDKTLSIKQYFNMIRPYLRDNKRSLNSSRMESSIR